MKALILVVALLIAYSLLVAKQEPIDVPAVSMAPILRKHAPDAPDDVWIRVCKSVDGLASKDECIPQTCEDRTRILLHDQQTPPAYWCHKVQP